MTSYEERVDLRKLNYIHSEFSFEMFKSVSKAFKSQAAAKEQYNLIQSYVSNRLKCGLVMYDYASGKSDGRLFAKGGIQGLCKNIRGFLADHTIDIDMVNAHPVILENVCKKIKIFCPNLSHYITNRDEVLESICKDDSCDTHTAKTSILIATNCTPKQTFKTNSDFLKNYTSEMKKIRKVLLETESYDYLKDFARHDKGNFEGSFVNHILCKYENIILEHVRKYFTDNDYEIFALMFDGLMIYSNEARKINISHLEEYIFEQTSMTNVKFSIKEHSTNITIPDTYEPILRPDYKTLKKSFERSCCKVDDYFICDGRAYKKGQLKDKFENLFCWEEGKKKPFIGIWLTDPDMRMYDRADNYPKSNMCPKNVYNLWKPFAVEDVCMSDSYADMMKTYISEGADFFFNHIKVLCNHEQVLFEFVETWLAQMLQYPEHKTIELIFISREGAGKGMFKEFLRGMLGGAPKTIVTSDPQNDIFGSFNEKLLYSFLIILEEVNKAGTYGKNDQKKSLITDSTVSIRQKGLPSIEVTSYHRFIDFTNHPNPTQKNARRDLTILCSNEKINDTNYWNAGFSFAKDKYVCREIYDRLMAKKVKPTITAVDIPESNFDTFIKDIQRNPILRFLDHISTVHTGRFTRTAPSFYEEWLSFKADNHMSFIFEIDNFIASIKILNLAGCNYFKTVGLAWSFKIDCDILASEVKR